MTDAPETDASFLAPVSGACVRGITSDGVRCTWELELDVVKNAGEPSHTGTAVVPN